MNWFNILYWNRKRKVFSSADCTESDLIQYSVDHLEAAGKLYELSNRWTWQYLHSAAFLSHLSIELLLKACLLNLEGQFPAEHDLKRLFRRLRKKGIELSDQNKEWLNYLNHCNELRYPNPESKLEVDINHWKQTKALFEELRMTVPKEIQKVIVTHERYRSNVKSGKTIWPETEIPNGRKR
jgi:HEPN domain-containing protein